MEAKMRRKFLILFSLVFIVLVSAVLLADDFYTVRTEYDANNNPVYIGRADPGTANTDAKWQIRKLLYDGSNNCTHILFAEGSWKFKFRWSSRAVYNYY